MFQQAEKTIISLKPEQRQVLWEMAHREGQEIEVFIEHILQNVVEKQQGRTPRQKHERIRQNFDRIRRHRKAFLAKRDNRPLSIDTVALLEQIRDEHDEHALALLRHPCD